MTPKVSSLAAARRQTAAIERPIMVRDLDGRIYYWNSDAEEKYGIDHQHALGNVSHDLLRTVFPQPLDVINCELIHRGYWKGELIHTRADGTQVKVQSNWQLYRDAEGQLFTVLEVNDNFLPVEPANAHFTSMAGIGAQLRRVRSAFRVHIWWFLAPVLVALALLAGVILFTPAHHIPPIQ